MTEFTRRASLVEILERSYRGKRILVTGHTGFVGSWLCSVLVAAGAEVTGLALEGEHGCLAEVTKLEDVVSDLRGDIRSADLVCDVMRQVSPEVVFHLAAQALVFDSFEDPVGTFATNVMGTAHVLEALRSEPGVRACVVVTSDKCYALGNHAHVESDPLGGEDPYSASKAGSELVAHAYSSSFWPDHSIGLATARAGNIIGGGDVARNRIIPDCARATAIGEPVSIRHPNAVRPWQHVLDAVAGYLRLGDALLSNPAGYSGGWNFGPPVEFVATVAEVVDLFRSGWLAHSHNQVDPARIVEAPNLVEREFLSLVSDRAHQALGWSALLDLPMALDWTAEFYYFLSQSPSPGAVRDLLADQYQRFSVLDSHSAAAGVPVRHCDEEFKIYE